jgi:hypothetical protein
MKMKITGLTLLVLISFFTACKKDKYTTEPQLKFKSVSPEVVQRGAVVEFVCSFTDEEGDVDSIFLVQKFYSGSNVTFVDTLRNNTYEQIMAPLSRSGEITMFGEHGTTNSGYKSYPWTAFVTRDTTATIGMLIIDKAGQRSNFVESDKYVLKKP